MNNKLLRSELKSIVKECLVEILSEGLLNTAAPQRQKSVVPTQKKRKSHLDNIKFNKKRKPVNTNITKDPILNEILADTAKSTLHEQAGAEAKSNKNNLVALQGDDAAKIVDSTSPEDIFGESADKWASLAFS